MLANLRAYHRPVTVVEAIGLLREGAALLGGGTELLGLDDDRLEAVIDLAPLSLDYIRVADEVVRIGAMTTLKRLADDEAVQGLAGGILGRAIRQAAPATIRAAATLGGTLAGSKGGEEIPTVLLALGARVSLATPDPVEMPLALMLANKADALAGAIITEVTVPLTAAGGGFAFVSRTPADRALLCAAAVGDRVIVSDGRMVSEEYRREVAPVLVRRALGEAIA